MLNYAYNICSGTMVARYFFLIKNRRNNNFTLSSGGRCQDVNDAFENVDKLMEEDSPDADTSLLPAEMNSRIAERCIDRSGNMNSASYADKDIRSSTEHISSKVFILLFETCLTQG